MLELKFGKYKGQDLEELYEKNKSYCKWLYGMPWIKTKKEIFEYLDSKFKDDKETYINWGKYKNKSISEIAELDVGYIHYLKNNDYVKKECTYILDAINKIPLSLLESYKQPKGWENSELQPPSYARSRNWS